MVKFSMVFYVVLVLLYIVKAQEDIASGAGDAGDAGIDSSRNTADQSCLYGYKISSEQCAAHGSDMPPNTPEQEDSIENIAQDTVTSKYEPEQLPNFEKLIIDIENLGNAARNATMSDEIDAEDIDKIYNGMVIILDDINKQINTPDNVYKFLKLGGLQRVIADNIKLDDAQLKTRLLLLTKIMFDVAPTTTNALIPIFFVDNILDIFENENLALKAHALDILYLWLPNNPKLQARVMKLKGLAPFYEQITNLDMSVVKNLLDLFNKILEEHIKVRNEDQSTMLDAEKRKYYQRIGLIELMSTPMVCNGLMNIFATSWQYNTVDNNVMITVFETMKNAKQFCLKYYYGKDKAVKLFKAFHAFVKDDKNLEYFMKNSVDVMDLISIVEDYLVDVKDEL